MPASTKSRSSGAVAGRPRFGRPQDDIVWRGVCKAEETVVKRQRGHEIEHSLATGTQPPPIVDTYYPGPLGGRDGARLPRGATVHKETGEALRPCGGPPPPKVNVDQGTSALVLNKEIGAHPTSNAGYGWFVERGKDTRGNGEPAKYHGLKKSNLFS